MILWIVFVIFIEYYSVGVTILAKRSGMKKYGLCMIPFYSFFYMNRVLGGFNVLGIKVAKWGRLMIQMTVICLCAFLYSEWGVKNLTERNATPLTEIMLVPICACCLIAYVSFMNSTLRALFLMKSDFKCQWLVCALLLPIPFLLTTAGERRIVCEDNKKKEKIK